MEPSTSITNSSDDENPSPNPTTGSSNIEIMEVEQEEEAAVGGGEGGAEDNSTDIESGDIIELIATSDESSSSKTGGDNESLTPAVGLVKAQQNASAVSTKAVKYAVESSLPSSALPDSSNNASNNLNFFQKKSVATRCCPRMESSNGGGNTNKIAVTTSSPLQRLDDDHHLLHNDLETLPPMTTMSRQGGNNTIRRQSQPGAFREGGWNQGEEQDDGDDANGGDPDNERMTDNFNARLSVANLVQEDNACNLPRGTIESHEIIAAEEAARKARKQKTRRKLLMYLATGGLIILLSIILATVFGNEKETNIKDEVEVSATAAPSLTVEEHLLSFLPEESRASILEVQSSPQYQAFLWLLEDIHHNPVLLEQQVDRLLQRYAMSTLYYSTTGDQWINNQDWLQHNIHECDWYNRPEFALKDSYSYIQGYLEGFFNADNTNPPTCNVLGMYEHLWLDANNLKGTIPEELYLLLPSLKTMSLGLNELEGTISTRIGYLAQLEGLAIFWQKNAGTIPTQIGLATHLRYLALISNNHGGEIPTEIWHLSHIDHLYLSGNPHLLGTIPSAIGTFTNMKFFHLHDVNVTGAFPSEFGVMEDLLQLDVAKTSITGTIPSQIGRWKSIFSLHLNDNDLNGPVPTQVGLLTNLTELSLQNNYISGPIPSEIGSLTFLETLNFANNSLVGEIPQTFSAALQEQQGSLHTIQLEGNEGLSGMIPENICSLGAVKTCTTETPTTSSCNNNTTSDYFHGLTFDCTSLLCGCNCTCAR